MTLWVSERHRQWSDIWLQCISKNTLDFCACHLYQEEMVVCSQTRAWGVLSSHFDQIAIQNFQLTGGQFKLTILYYIWFKFNVFMVLAFYKIHFELISISIWTFYDSLQKYDGQSESQKLVFEWKWVKLICRNTLAKYCTVWPTAH